ncbi:MAG TPA: MMPL family transporter, partial [Micromonosporaceae bacterium]
MAALGRMVASSRTRALIVVALWVVLAGVVPRLTPTVDEVKQDGGSNAPVPGTQSASAHDLLREKFPDQQGMPAIIVLRHPGGLTQADEAEVARSSAELTGARAPLGVDGVVSLATVPQARAQLVSPDGTTTMMLVPIKGLASNDERFADTVRRIRQVAGVGTGSTEIRVTGPAGI